MENNPLLIDWSMKNETPPFHQIKNEHFAPAFEEGMREHKEEVMKVAQSGDEPTFENTIEALEKSGLLLNQVASVFYNLTSAHTNPELQKIQMEMSSRLAKHTNEIYLNQELFKRVNSLYEERDKHGLSPEQHRLLERYAKGFLRSGAQLAPDARERISQISQRLAELGTQFSQNVLSDEGSYALVLETDADIDGLPDFLLRASAQTAEDRGLSGKKAITLSRSSIEPFLQFSRNRGLRETAFNAWVQRGASGGDTDNRALIAETVALRNEKAKLLGFSTFAEYKLDNTMAKTTDAARTLLERVWSAARAQVDEECAELQQEMIRSGVNETLQPWDWRYYSEKVRKAKYELNEAEIKPYFQLEKIIEGAFDTANRLFGLSFEERSDVETYHADVRVWDVKDSDGKIIAMFFGDYFARPSKQGGAWMSSFRSQEKLNGDLIPIVVNVMNFVKGADGEPSLLTYDDARTLFHEFGHGLHGMLSNVTYPSLSGTSVSRDFVELPSQLYEHWLSEPAILKKYAVHAETGEPIPDDLLEKILKAKNFNQGFMATEYLACAILDLDIHEVENTGGLDVDQFEADALGKIDMPKEIVMRHRLPHFLHLFSGDGYASGYYSYMWSEVMDCDAFNAFEETGDAFNKNVAEKLKKYIYSSGDTMDPEKAYEAFRGRQPSVEALLRKRGFSANNQ